MTRVSYGEKLRDPRWQRKRLEVMQRDDFTCQHCFDKESPLHVHHRVYVRGQEPWEYELAALVTLCEGCHEFEENVSQALHDLVLALRPTSVGNADSTEFSFLAGCIFTAAKGESVMSNGDDFAMRVGGLVHLMLHEEESADAHAAFALLDAASDRAIGRDANGK